MAGWDYLGPDNNKRADNMAIAVDRIHSSTLALNEALEDDELVPRDCFDEFKAKANSARTDKQNPSLLVYGARGVGKTTVVRAALQGTAGVLGMSYHGDGTDLEQRLEELVLKLAGPSEHGPKADVGDPLRAILAFYKRVHKCRFVFVIDINSKIMPAALSNLLLAAKDLGFEEKLATFIFVVSASRSALGLTVGISESRVRGYRAPDFNTAEAHNYLAKHLSPFPELAEFVVERIGRRAMDLVEVCSECRGAESEVECRERVEAYRAARIKDARFALRGFIATAEENATFKEDASLAFFRELLAGTQVLDDGVAADAFGFKKPKLLLLALAEYHAFAIDPFDHSISMQSHFMQIAIKEHLRAQASNAAGTSAPSSA